MLLLLCALLSAVVLSACSSDDDVVPSPQPAQSALRFSFNGVQTRLDYNFEHTNFTEGDTIGCVIAEVNDDGTYKFLRNSAWSYRSDGMLIFQYYWGNRIVKAAWGGETSEFGRVYSNDIETEAAYNTTPVSAKILIQEKYRDETTSTLDESFVYSPYLNGTNKKLAFFFYYPYVNGNLLYEDVLKVYNQKVENNKTIFYKELDYPNIATNEDLSFTANGQNYELKEDGSSIDPYLRAFFLTGTVIDDTGNAGNYWNIQGNKYGWTDYPCFVNHTQGDPSAQGEVNDKRLQNSDFLWAASPEISASTQHTVNLTFKKKTATILVYSENRLADIYFTPNGGQTLKRGKRIDLSTGELSDYEYSTASDASAQQKNMYFNADEHIVPCYRGQDTAEGQPYYFYRIVLPAQENCRFTMYIKGDFDRNQSTPDEWKAINLSDDDGLTELKEGYLYTIRISKDGRTTIRINDWQPDGWFEIEEVTD